MPELPIPELPVPVLLPVPELPVPELPVPVSLPVPELPDPELPVPELPEPAPVVIPAVVVSIGVVPPWSVLYPDPAPVTVGVVRLVPVVPVHPATTSAAVSTRAAPTARMMVRLFMAREEGLIV